MDYSKILTERELFIKLAIPEILEAKNSILITQNEKGQFTYSSFGIPLHDDSLENHLRHAYMELLNQDDDEDDDDELRSIMDINT